MDPIRTRLRTATDDLHTRVDSHPVLAPLATGQGTPDAVAAALAVLAPFFATHEAAVAHWHPDLVPTPRVSQRIASDLAALGTAALSVRVSPHAGDAGRAVGVAWVLAGSRHGAAAMARRFAGRPGRLGCLAALAPHADDHAVWQRVLAALLQADPGQAEAGARTAFTTLLALADQAVGSASAPATPAQAG